MEHRKQLRDEHGVVSPIVGGQGIAHAFWLRAPDDPAALGTTSALAGVLSGVAR